MNRAIASHQPPATAGKVIDLAAHRGARQQAEHDARRQLMGQAIDEVRSMHEAGQLGGILLCVQRIDGDPLMVGFGDLASGSDAALAAATRLMFRMAGGL